MFMTKKRHLDLIEEERRRIIQELELHLLDRVGRIETLNNDADTLEKAGYIQGALHEIFSMRAFALIVDSGDRLEREKCLREWKKEKK